MEYGQRKDEVTSLASKKGMKYPLDLRIQNKKTQANKALSCLNS